jgi:hypothetical protein
MLTSITAIKAAADLLEAGETAQWLVSSTILINDKDDLDTWFSTETLAYTVELSDVLFTERVQTGKEMYENVNYHLIKASYPSA